MASGGRGISVILFIIPINSNFHFPHFKSQTHLVVNFPINYKKYNFAMKLKKKKNLHLFIVASEVESLYDDQGNMLSNKVRVRWGKMHNFKCVDYFQEFISI